MNMPAKTREDHTFSLFGSDLVQSLISLGLVAISTVAAGLLLASSADRLEDYPGLLLMVPAAIALRGNIFGALSSRLGTAIHSGTYRLSLSPSSVMGENITASLTLSLGTSLILAVLAKGIALALGIADSISIDRFIVISILGGMMASVVVMVASLGLTALSVRYKWNPDNVSAPLVTAAGDLLTIPALIWSATLVDSSKVASGLSILFVLLAFLAVGIIWLTGRQLVRAILRESAPVLVAAIFVDLLAGVAIERQISDFVDFPTLLILLPGYLAVAGALGSALSSRFSTKLHLGLISPASIPQKNARRDLLGFLLVAAPVFTFLAGLTLLAGVWGDLAGPSAGSVFGVALIGGVMATIVVLLVAYYGTAASVKMGVNPDTYGIPITTAVLDLTSTLTLTLSIGILGVF